MLIQKKKIIAKHAHVYLDFITVNIVLVLYSYVFEWAKDSFFLYIFEAVIDAIEAGSLRALWWLDRDF